LNAPLPGQRAGSPQLERDVGAQVALALRWPDLFLATAAAAAALLQVTTGAVGRARKERAVVQGCLAESEPGSPLVVSQPP